MERGVSPAQIRVTHSVVYQLICQVCKRATVWNCLSSVIIDQIGGQREREEPPPPPIALFAGGVVVDGYEERTFWKFCVYTSDTCACTFRSVIKQLRFATTRGEIIPPWNWRIAERESGRKDFNITFNRNRSDFNWCNFLNEEYNGSCIVTFFINLLPFWFVSKKFLRATFGNFIEKLAIRMQ